LSSLQTRYLLLEFLVVVILAVGHVPDLLHELLYLVVAHIVQVFDLPLDLLFFIKLLT